MHIGELLLTSGTNSVLTPWFGRQADNARFTYETVYTIGSPTFTVEVFHKNKEDLGPGSSWGTLSWTTYGNFKAATAAGLKEMVRFKLTVSVSSGTGGVLYRFVEPTWFDQASDTSP
jgi:hypothetical protein